MFELKSRDGLGRIGSLRTKHGVVETPTLLPVINPNQITIAPSVMRKKFGTSIVITNSYVINKSEKLRDRALSKGLHSLLDFDGPIMTDSGTFQAHVYGDISVTNEEIVTFQREIGSDIGSILDVFSEPYSPKRKARKAIDETLIRAEEAVGIKKKMFLAGGIQGSTHLDLREECASRMSEISSAFISLSKPSLQSKYTSLRCALKVTVSMSNSMSAPNARVTILSETAPVSVSGA